MVNDVARAVFSFRQDVAVKSGRSLRSAASSTASYLVTAGHCANSSNGVTFKTGAGATLNVNYYSTALNAGKEPVDATLINLTSKMRRDGIFILATRFTNRRCPSHMVAASDLASFDFGTDGYFIAGASGVAVTTKYTQRGADFSWWMRATTRSRWSHRVRVCVL